MLRSLQATKNSSLRSLHMFDEHDELKEAIDREELMIKNQRKKMLQLTAQGKVAIRAGQLREACEISLKIKYLVLHSSNLYVNCPETLDDDLNDLQNEIHDRLSDMVDSVKQQTSEAAKAISSCKLNEAEETLQTAATMLSNVYAPAKDQCRPALESFELESELQRIRQTLNSAKEKCVQPKAPSSTKKPASNQQAQHSAEDCYKLQDKYRKEWKKLDQTASWLACKKKAFSGCATKFVGCRTGLLPKYVFSHKRCKIPGYLSCAKAAYSTYISCVTDCNAAWRNSRQKLSPCGTKCENATDLMIEACEK
jgi:Tfp pilus assembly protein PilP